MNIILIGFMASGKTTIGKRLAEDLHMNFCDTDNMIEEKVLTSIENIFLKYGENYFRTLEKQTIKELMTAENTVISVGGGAVTDSENFSFLKKLGKTIYLNTPLDKIFNNLKGKFRPLIGDTIDYKKVQTLYESRLPVYRQGDICINTDNLSIEETVQKIKAILMNE